MTEAAFWQDIADRCGARLSRPSHVVPRAPGHTVMRLSWPYCWTHLHVPLSDDGCPPMHQAADLALAMQDERDRLMELRRRGVGVG
jgi:hypothetical protein